MSKKILIVSQSHICRNPRVLKEAIILSKAGYSISILTAIYSKELLQQDLKLLKNTGIKYEFYSDLSSYGFTPFKTRLIRKLAVILQTRFNIESKFSLGYNITSLTKHLTKHDADLYIMHQEVATVIGSEMVNKHNVAFDLEDWYSEDLLPEARKARPIQLLKKAEKAALTKGACCYTTSNAMAQGLKAAYKADQLPAVIYNSFNSSPLLQVTGYQSKTIKLYWFSQTIGPGRGLEFFISCLAKSNFSWELYLRGNISVNYHNYLNTIIAGKDKLTILPMINNDELLPDMANYDLGLALEPASPSNKNLTISNKLFHYMAAGLPVIASDTEGHTEIGNKHPSIIFLYKNNNSSCLIDLLNTIGKTIKNDQQTIRENVIKIHDLTYSWEIESKKLLQLVDHALQQKG